MLSVGRTILSVNPVSAFNFSYNGMPRLYRLLQGNSSDTSSNAPSMDWSDSAATPSSIGTPGSDSIHKLPMVYGVQRVVDSHVENWINDLPNEFPQLDWSFPSPRLQSSRPPTRYNGCLPSMTLYLHGTSFQDRKKNKEVNEPWTQTTFDSARFERGGGPVSWANSEDILSRLTGNGPFKFEPIGLPKEDSSFDSFGLLDEDKEGVAGVNIQSMSGFRDQTDGRLTCVSESVLSLATSLTPFSASFVRDDNDPIIQPSSRLVSDNPMSSASFERPELSSGVIARPSRSMDIHPE
ncbi:hypothetical protein D9757_006659 [Collybiopsis confluens]|uniref:Uncharacterized protein n=1 Tax=Collybiopsis confluens TaxID=2823264 RepID=A0A8H5MAE9_9AGAR|nr:hypothetical protein D9757_014892 [Collybiopsis confluens]KAF5386406.1 hypothetical protein D9757_006659 [Collybiopsis confluens]